MPRPSPPLRPALADAWAKARVAQAVPALLRDYVRTSYPPVTEPTGRAASESLLWWFLDQADLQALRPMVERLRTLLGPGETVWGIKRMPGGGAGIELYVYDPQREASLAPKGRDNPRSVTALVRGLAPVLEIDSRLDDDRFGYHMASLSLDAQVARTGRHEGFRIYPTGDRRRHGYDGLSFHVAGDRLVRENSYLFFQARTELAQVREMLAASLRAGSPRQQERLLDPALCACHTICFASKANGDALYWSRLDSRVLAGALAWTWPGPLAELVDALAEGDLAHLRWDLGVDFTAAATAPDEVELPKVGVYGFL